LPCTRATLPTAAGASCAALTRLPSLVLDARGPLRCPLCRRGGVGSPPLLADGCALSPQVDVVGNGTMAAGITEAIYLSRIAADGGRREPRDGDRLGAPRRAGIVESWQQAGSSCVFSSACAADGSRVAVPCSEAAHAHARASVSACCPCRVGRYHPRTHGRGVRDSLCRWARQKNVDQCTGIPPYSRH